MTRTISSQGLSSRSIVSTQIPSNEVKVCHNPSQEIAQQNEQVAFCKLEIVHVTNGRIRIRFTGDSCDSNLENISQKLKQYQGVKEVVTHQHTGSLIVNFDADILPLSQMLGILQELGIELSSVSKIDPLAAWKSLDFWQEQSISLIPLITGLAVTGGLGIHGLAAIPVYIITADATRRIIDYLEPQLSLLNLVNLEKLDIKKETSSLISTSDRLTDHTDLVYNIAHAIPGRIRFHIPQLAKDRAYSNRLEKLLKADTQVTSVRINQNAASIAIAYQPSEIPTTHWVNLIESALDINPPIETVPPPSESAEVMQKDVASIWSQMKSSALSYSLAYMANLPLN